MGVDSLGVCYLGDCNFYVNGMCADPKEVDNIALEIERISGNPTESLFNDASTYEKVCGMVVKLLIGTVCGAYTAESIRRSHKLKIRDGVVGGSSLALLAWGVSDFYQMQKRKEELGEVLATKIKAQLLFNPSSQIRLITHSQGADVGQIAMNILGKSYHKQIHIVNFGGKTHFSGNFASVVNFENDRDLIAKFASLFNRRKVTPLKVKSAPIPSVTVLEIIYAVILLEALS